MNMVHNRNSILITMEKNDIQTFFPLKKHQQKGKLMSLLALIM